MHDIDDNNEVIINISETPSFLSNMPILNVDNEVNDIHAIRDYHH